MEKFFFILFFVCCQSALRCKGVVHSGATKLLLESSSSKINITVSFGRCFNTPVLHVDARTVSVSSGMEFKIYVLSNSLNSFDAELRRTDAAAGWQSSNLAIEWKAYQHTAAFNQTPGNFDIYYYYMSPEILTWSSARKLCRSLPKRDLCTLPQICNNGQIRLTGIAFGDNWTPIIESVDNWMQIGDHTNAVLRLCWDHHKKFGPQTWGNLTGPCSVYASPHSRCTIKGHVFCCRRSL